MLSRATCVLSLFLSGCATLPAPAPDMQRLTPGILAALDGLYNWEGRDAECNPTSQAYGCTVGFWRVVRDNAPSLYRFETWGFSDSTATVRLETVGTDEIRVIATRTDSSAETTVLRARLHDDGTVRLRGASPLIGAPPFVWAAGAVESRLALNTRGDLVYHSVGSRVGFFSMIPIMTGRWDNTWTFRRIE